MDSVFLCEASSREQGFKLTRIAFSSDLDDDRWSAFNEEVGSSLVRALLQPVANEPEFAKEVRCKLFSIVQVAHGGFLCPTGV